MSAIFYTPRLYCMICQKVCLKMDMENSLYFCGYTENRHEFRLIAEDIKEMENKKECPYFVRHEV